MWLGNANLFFVTSLTEQLCARCVHDLEPEQCRNAACLCDLDAGTQGRVIGFSDGLDAHVARRLFDLGFVPGSTVEFLRKAPLRDPVMFRVADTEIVLRRREAEQILISQR